MDQGRVGSRPPVVRKQPRRPFVLGYWLEGVPESSSSAGERFDVEQVTLDSLDQ